MLLFLGREASQSALFSEALAKDYLKTSVHVLSESTFEVLLPKMDKKTPIVIENGATIGKHQDLLVQTIKERNLTIIMTDCDEGDLHDYGVAISPSGKYVAVENNSNGRRQKLLVVVDKKPSCEYSEVNVEKPGKQPIQPPREEEPTSTVDSSAQSPAATSVDAQTVQMESLAQFLKEVSKPSTEVSASVKASEPTHYWEHKTLMQCLHTTFSIGSSSSDVIVSMGDNDIGGEGRDHMSDSVIRKYRDSFGEMNSLLRVGNVQIIKV